MSQVLQGFLSTSIELTWYSSMTCLPPPDHYRPDREHLLHRINHRILQSLELQEILDATSAEIRAFLGTDRVMIYKFHPDGSGQVIAECRHGQRLPSLLGLNFPADDIPPHARELFVRARVRSVVDVEKGQIGQSSLRNLVTGDGSDDIRYRPLDLCHAEYLKAMGVKSSLVVPIFHHDQLWGLLVSHNAESKAIPEAMLQSVQLIVDQVSVAITQSALISHARDIAKREATINRITTLLHSLTTIELQPALEETVAAFQGSGGRLFIATDAFSFQKNSSTPAIDSLYKLYTCGTQPVFPDTAPLKLMEQYSVWQEHFQTGYSQTGYSQTEQPHTNPLQTCGVHQPWAISDLYQIPALSSLQFAFQSTSIRSILIVPLRIRQQLAGYLSIFRDEIETETRWAGRFDPDERQIYPRSSFEAWKESKAGQARPWTINEVELIQGLSNQFASAVEQYELYQHVQMLNADLEHQVRERTAQLLQATEQQRILFEVVTKMRKSLNIKKIFATVTREVRRVLHADRVGVYYFDPSSTYNNGEFVAEDVLPEFPSAMAIKIRDHCFGETYATKYRQGRVHVLDHVHAANLQNCHVELLNQFHVKASIIAPIMKGDDLWGLFCVHQCAHPREWDPSEIQFATQVAEQLGVALAQANLLSQTRQQAEQLAHALNDLHKAQTQLIQNEKMSSLGQLVAGVAHEINNPVNFIYGNLSHVTRYAEDLLGLIHLYQRDHPTPSSAIQAKTDAIDLDFLAEDLPKTLASMRIGADRIRQIVLSLRNFSRLDQAEIKLVDIHEGIDSTLLILQHRLKEKSESPGIELVKEYGNLPLVECYAGQLNQVFMNLISNAIDALEEWNATRSPEAIAERPATIRIRTEQLHNKQISIRIADNGVGMSEDVLHHLFDPFFTTKPVGKGTGLGLSISYQIVTEKHRGQLTCVSAPGQGAEFIITIPINQSFSGLQ